MNANPRRTIAALAVAGSLVAAGSAQAALQHFDGKVVGKNAAADTFRIKTESGKRVKFDVNGRTEFERIAGGFSGLERGLAVEVDAKRTDRGFVARQVEAEGDDGGSDDKRS
jgi:hypothetical protein